MGPLGVVEVDPLADDPFGPEAVGELVQVERLPSAARECLMALAAQLELVKRQILEADRRVRESVSYTHLTLPTILLV